MITVQMTRDILNRPPKILGLFTRKQFIGVVISALLIILLTIVLPFEFMSNLLIAMIPVFPVLIVAFFPENQTSPLVYAKFFLKRTIYGKDIRVHDGNSEYYRKPREDSNKKIARHKKYQGIR